MPTWISLQKYQPPIPNLETIIFSMGVINSTIFYSLYEGVIYT